jgi:hypothetical protein
MEKILHDIFYEEILRQCNFAILAYDDLEMLMQKRQEKMLKDIKQGYVDIDPDHTFDHSETVTRVFLLLQTILISCANLSKIFWPSHYEHDRKKECEECKERGETLRIELLFCDDGQILKSREMRNTFEHFDERLHAWFKESDYHNFVDTNIGPLGAVGGVATKDIFRWYDPSRRWLIFRGTIYKLRDVISSVEKLRGVIITNHSTL